MRSSWGQSVPSLFFVWKNTIKYHLKRSFISFESLKNPIYPLMLWWLSKVPDDISIFYWLKITFLCRKQQSCFTCPHLNHTHISAWQSYQIKSQWLRASSNKGFPWSISLGAIAFTQELIKSVANSPVLLLEGDSRNKIV